MENTWRVAGTKLVMGKKYIPWDTFPGPPSQHAPAGEWDLTHRPVTSLQSASNLIKTTFAFTGLAFNIARSSSACQPRSRFLSVTIPPCLEGFPLVSHGRSAEIDHGNTLPLTVLSAPYWTQNKHLMILFTWWSKYHSSLGHGNLREL